MIMPATEKEMLSELEQIAQKVLERHGDAYAAECLLP